MLIVERELAAVVYLLYAMDCIHWLKPGQVAMTRTLTQGWRTHACTTGSYTLLGRKPIVVQPFDLRPGFLILPDGLPAADRPRFLKKLLRRQLEDIGIITFFSWLGALNLLLLLPALLAANVFERWWHIPTILAAAVHAAIGIEVFFQAAPWRRAYPGNFWEQFVPLLLNPIAALRSGDILLRAAADGKMDPPRTTPLPAP